jgi:hypothetical protein
MYSIISQRAHFCKNGKKKVKGKKKKVKQKKKKAKERKSFQNHNSITFEVLCDQERHFLIHFAFLCG